MSAGSGLNRTSAKKHARDSRRRDERRLWQLTNLPEEQKTDRSYRRRGHVGNGSAPQHDSRPRDRTGGRSSDSFDERADPGIVRKSLEVGRGNNHEQVTGQEYT